MNDNRMPETEQHTVTVVYRNTTAEWRLIEPVLSRRERLQRRFARLFRRRRSAFEGATMRVFLDDVEISGEGE